MTQPTIPVLPNNFSSELGTTFGLHLDQNFTELVTSTTEIINNLALIQRDDGWIRNQSVGALAFTSDALTLMAGSSASPTGVDWRPIGPWASATLYEVGNIIETGSPAVAYVASTQHISSVFLTDYASGYWVVLSAARTLISADVISALGYTPVNRAGDTMTGALTLTTLSNLAGMEIDSSLIAGQDLLTVDKGIYSAYNSSAADIVYGFASNVVRDSGSSFAVGGQFSAIGTSGATAAMFGGNVNAVGLASFADALIGWEIDIGSFTPANTSAKRGLTVIFKNRADGATNPGEYNYPFPFGTYSSAGGGLGANKYNAAAVALHLDSQQRTATGEYCGFVRGLLFDEYSLDSETNASAPATRAYPIGIDFSNLHYYGGTNPVTAFNLEAAIALRDLQTIWWNRDPSAPFSTNKIKSYFNPATSRWIIDNGGAERFGVDVVTGTIYINGVPGSGGPTLTGANSWSGENTYNGPTYILGPYEFGTGIPIFGDFSNSALNFRTFFQTTTANSATEIGAVPRGVGGVAAFYCISDSQQTNGVVNRFSVSAAEAQIAATPIGTALAVPFTFYNNSIEVFRASTAGKLSVGTASAPSTGSNTRFAGPMQIDNPVAFSVNRAGSNFNIANATVVAVNWNTEDFDTNNSFDLATDRFTPPVGKYLLTGAFSNAASGSPDDTVMIALIYKNGAQHKSGNYGNVSALANSGGSTVTGLVEANGTDYFDFRVVQANSGGSTVSISGQSYDTYFQGYKIA